MDVSDADLEFLYASSLVLQVGLKYLKKKERKEKRFWMSALYKSRKRYNASDMIEDLKREPSGQFHNFCRMSSTDFELLLCKIGPVLKRQDTIMRSSIPVQERFAVALRFFATGDSYASLSYLFKFSKNTVSKCVDSVCEALTQELQDEIKLPKNEDEWLKIAEGFQNAWNFPNCLGAIDGKHVVLQAPMNSSSEFFNYKGTFSVVLLAVVDSRYCFSFVDIGCQGRISDGGVFQNSSLFQKLETQQMKIPPDGKLPSSEKILPYVFVGDSAFALSQHMMKPYPGQLQKGNRRRIFNYRLSRARRVVENTFEIMSSVFRVFRKPFLLEPEKVKKITLTCAILHNFMRRSKTSKITYTPSGSFDTEIEGQLIPGSWRNDRNGMSSFLALNKKPRKPGEEAKKIRNSFAEYFSTSGKLSWQDKFC